MLKQESNPGENEEYGIKPVKEKPRFLGSCRFKLGLIMFLANLVLYLNRVNINMTVVCMLDVIEISDDVTMVTDANYYNRTIIQRNSSILTSLPLGESDEITYRNGTTVPPAPYNKSRNNLTESRHRHKFQWSKSEISHILSAYYYGCLLTQIPSGNLARRFGGKHVITTCCIFTIISTILTPMAASHSATLLFFVRFLLGIAGGLFAPATYVLIVNWTTATERASILGLAAAGQPVGIVISFISSGFFCSLGWFTVFYIHGSITCIFLFLWMYEIYNTPSQHPRIQQAELNYLTQRYGQTTDSVKKETPKTPWKQIFLSKALWAVVLAHIAYIWSYYTFIINIPMFMKEVYEFVIEKNGILSALPYLFSMFSLISVGSLSALIIQKGWLSLKMTRKLFAGLGLCGTSICLISAGHVQYEQRYIAVVIICISCIFSSLTFGGILPSYADFAGKLSGTVFAIGNTFGMAIVIPSALLTGLLTPNGLQEEWQRVFYVAAGLNVVSTFVFVAFGKSSLQEWAVAPKDNVEMCELNGSVSMLHEEEMENKTELETLSVTLKLK